VRKWGKKYSCVHLCVVVLLKKQGSETLLHFALRKITENTSFYLVKKNGFENKGNNLQHCHILGSFTPK
jgi:hypothetical protein